MQGSRETRRSFLRGGVVGCAALGVLSRGYATAGAAVDTDFHSHLDNSTIDAACALAKERGVRLGIVEHAGTKENVYPKVLSNDAELKAYLEMLEGKGVYKGIQAEWTDWMGCFSKPALMGLDYVITDAMTYPDKDGKRTKLWEKGVEEKVDMSNHEAFMDRFVDWHVHIIETEPLDILVNVSWLPDALAAEYEALWTSPRIGRVIEAMKAHGVACEISSSYELPKLKFAKAARAAGLKFAYGSNGRYPKMGLLEYSRKLAAELGLGEGDMFVPGKAPKAVERRL